MSAAPAPAIRPEVLHQAAEWLLRLQDEPVGEADRQAWRRWLASSEEHARAWRRAGQLTRLLDEVPDAIGSAPLQRMRRQRRRAALGAIASLLAGAPLAWLALKRQPWQYAVADHSTGIGDLKRVRLDDGSLLHLNTDTRVALRYTAGERRLLLLRGEVLVQTAPDPRTPARPFLLQTVHGQLQALGTRFAVRLFDAFSRVAVEEGAVRVSPAAAPQDARIVAAGTQATFDAARVSDASSLRRVALDWFRGILNAQAMPLGEVVAELARYRNGVVRCDPEVAALPVSGVFQLADTDRALQLLQDTFPIRVQFRSRLWVLVSPR
ncbi:MAG: FecR domain-containing protein [Pseudoxanthomonas sp.]